METFYSWEMLFPIGTLILLIALVYGLMQYRKRNRANDEIAQKVVRDRYEHLEKWSK